MLIQDGYFLSAVIVIIISVGSTVHQEPLQTSNSACFGSNGPVRILPNCTSGNVIAIKKFWVGAKLLSTRCPTVYVNDTTCCSPSANPADDCVWAYDSYDNYHILCNGLESCDVGVQNVRTLGSCDQTIYPEFTTFAYITYVCIDASSITKTCSMTTVNITGSSTYVASDNFPNPMTTSTSACNCSLQTDDPSVKLQVITIQRNLTCNQSLSLLDSGQNSLVEWNCSDNTYFEKTFAVDSDYFILNLNSERIMAGGNFWVEIRATSSTANLTLDCPSKLLTTTTTTTDSTTPDITTTIDVTTTEMPSTSSPLPTSNTPDASTTTYDLKTTTDITTTDVTTTTDATSTAVISSTTSLLSSSITPNVSTTTTNITTTTDVTTTTEISSTTSSLPTSTTPDVSTTIPDLTTTTDAPSTTAISSTTSPLPTSTTPDVSTTTTDVTTTTEAPSTTAIPSSTSSLPTSITPDVSTTTMADTTSTIHSTTTMSASTDSSSEDEFLIPFIVAVGLAVVLIIVMIVIVYLLCRKKRPGPEEGKKHDLEKEDILSGPCENDEQEDQVDAPSVEQNANSVHVLPPLSTGMLLVNEKPQSSEQMTKTNRNPGVEHEPATTSDKSVNTENAGVDFDEKQTQVTVDSSEQDFHAFVPTENKDTNTNALPSMVHKSTITTRVITKDKQIGTYDTLINANKVEVHVAEDERVYETLPKKPVSAIEYPMNPEVGDKESLPPQQNVGSQYVELPEATSSNPSIATTSESYHLHNHTKNNKKLRKNKINPMKNNFVGPVSVLGANKDINDTESVNKSLQKGEPLETDEDDEFKRLRKKMMRAFHKPEIDEKRFQRILSDGAQRRNDARKHKRKVKKKENHPPNSGIETKSNDSVDDSNAIKYST